MDTMSVMTREEFLHLADVAAARLAKRATFWWSDKDDLRNEALCAMLGAEHNYDPATGVAPQAYFWKVCVFSLRRYLWRNSSPVSGGAHRPERAYAGLRRAMIDDGAHVDDERPRGAVLVYGEPLQDELLDEKRWHERAIVAIEEAHEDRRAVSHDVELYDLARELPR
jgi:hypothetical protein